MEPTRRSPTRSSIAFAFAASHAALDGTLQRVVAALAADDADAAERAFARFQRGLRHHLRVEETFLFDEVARTGNVVERDLVHRLRDAHHALEAHVEMISGRFAQRRGLGRELQALRDSIAAHEREEEHDFFPACDRRVPPARRGEAVRAVRRGPSGS